MKRLIVATQLVSTKFAEQKKLNCPTMTIVCCKKMTNNGLDINNKYFGSLFLDLSWQLDKSQNLTCNLYQPKSSCSAGRICQQSLPPLCNFVQSLTLCSVTIILESIALWLFISPQNVTPLTSLPLISLPDLPIHCQNKNFQMLGRKDSGHDVPPILDMDSSKIAY